MDIFENIKFVFSRDKKYELFGFKRNKMKIKKKNEIVWFEKINLKILYYNFMWILH